jgi:peptidoglycan lytic transglycosylase G
VSRPDRKSKRWARRLVIAAITVLALLVVAAVATRYVYNENLKPASASQEVQTFVVEEGATTAQIAEQLESAGLIRSAWAFKLYIYLSSRETQGALQAGTYELAPSRGVKEIVAQLSHGKIATNLVTILPARRIDQVRDRLIQEGFSEQDVDDALLPANYAGHPALVDKPAEATLEGYLYPESYHRTASTKPHDIIAAALDEMSEQLTPDLKAAWAARGLSPYQAVTLASIVEKEASSQTDRDQAAQVFLKRLSIGMRLESDATTSYGAVLDGQEYVPNSGYESPYNTYINTGVPPSPVSNVTNSSLRAVAYPANTDWLYFVSGDDGTTHFSKTLAEQQANIQKYCKTCRQ